MLVFFVETVGATGQSLYFIVFNPITGQVWNTTLNTGAGGWEAYNSGHWAQYAIAMTEKAGSGYYSGTYPVGIEDALTTEVIYANAAPTLGDAPIGIGQSQGVSVRSICGDAAAAQKLGRSAGSQVLGTVIAGTLGVRAFTTDVSNPETNAYAGRSLYFVSGDLSGQGSTITSYDPDTGLITVAGAFTTAPAADDIFVIC